MVESNLGVSMFILLIGGAVLSYLGYNNCYLPDDQEVKAQYIMDAVRCGIGIEYYSDCVVRYRYRMGKEKLKAVSTVVAIAAAVGFVASNVSAVYRELRAEGWIGLAIALLLIGAIALVVFVIRDVLYEFVLRYEKMGAKNMYNYYYREGVILIEEKKDKEIERIIKKSRSE